MLELDPEDDFMETDEPAEEIPESKKYQEKIFQSLEEFILFVFYQQEGSNRTSVRRMNLLLLLLADPRIDVKKFPKSTKSIFFFFFLFSFSFSLSIEPPPPPPFSRVQQEFTKLTRR